MDMACAIWQALQPHRNLVHLRHSGSPREPARDKTGRLCASLAAAWHTRVLAHDKRQMRLRRRGTNGLSTHRWRRQSGANSSLKPNFLASWENTGKFINLG